MSEVLGKKSGKGNRLKKQILFLVAYALLFVIANVITGGRFFGGINMSSIVTHAVYYGVVGFGMAFVMTAGIVDMSVGANILLSSNFGAFLAVTMGWGYAGLILGSVVCATILEIITVFISVKLKIPSWITGLAMALLYEGALVLYSNYLTATQGTSVIFMEDTNYFGNMPGILIVWIVCFLACYFIYNYTTIGMNIRAPGNHPQVAQAMGVKKDRTLILSAVIAGVFIGIAAMVIISMNKRMVACAGMNSISQIFKSLATFLLAASFQSIVDVPVGLLLSSFFIAGLFNFMTLIGVPSGTGQEIMLGVMVILCGLVSKLNYKGVVK